MSSHAKSTTPAGFEPFQALIPGTSQAVATSASSEQSSALGSGTTIVQLHATKACYVAFGSNPTATSSSMYLPAGILACYGVTPGTKIAALRVSEDGSLNIVEGAN